MFEINLVPDVKNELLKKLRMRNLIIFISIIVAAAAAGTVALLGSVVAGQNIAIANQDAEIACRLEGGEKCNKDFGTAVLKIANLDQFLTIQDQMTKISELNDSKLLISRLFGVLDVILPSYDAGDEEDIRVSELNANLPTATLNFDAQGDSKSEIDYAALEVFLETIELAYYDHGSYMRAEEDGGFVKIPMYCVDEVIEEGKVVGIYHKGTPGCETSMLSQAQQQELTGENGETQAVEQVDIRIVRDYKTKKERDEYKKVANGVDGGFYFFESACAQYGGDDNETFDESATREKCKLAPSVPTIRDSSNARNSDNILVLRFSASVVLNKEVFRFANKHMRVIGPSRQNVTDSYMQIRDMFDEAAVAVACDPAVDSTCTEGTNNGS